MGYSGTGGEERNAGAAPTNRTAVCLMSWTSASEDGRGNKRVFPVEFTGIDQNTDRVDDTRR